jgi:hypothetical protein
MLTRGGQQGTRRMDLREEFHHHAHECLRMAAETKDKLAKATWTQMANRWAGCG